MDSYLKLCVLIGGAVGAFTFGLDAGSGRPLVALLAGLQWFALGTLAAGVVYGLAVAIWRVGKRVFRRARASPSSRGT